MQARKTVSNIETIKHLYDLFNQRKWQEIANLCTEDIEVLNPKNGEQFQVKKSTELPQRIAAIAHKHPGITEKILYIQESGNLVYVQFLTKGQSKNGTHWEQLAWNIFTVDTGKITKVATYSNLP